jgi:parvulin-like peptidyl-prolyl isomerase
MVEEELLVQESRRLGIQISAEEIERDVATARARFENAAAFQQELARQYMDETQYRRKLRRQRAIDRVLARQVDPFITISEDEMSRFYAANPQRYSSPEKIRMRHILIRKAPGDDGDHLNEARRRIEALRGKLDQGEDFAVLAKQFSEEPTREQGGDLGYIQRGQMLPGIEAVAFDLDVGAISPILTTEHGFHLIQVTGRRPAVMTSFEDARPDIQKTLRQFKRERAVRAYIDSLRQKADIYAAQ